MKEKIEQVIHQLKDFSSEEKKTIETIIDTIIQFENYLGENDTKLIERMSKLSFFTKSIFQNKIEAFLVNSSNGEMLINPFDFGVGYELATSGSYGLDEIEYISQFLNDESSDILVVGAHIGSLLIPLSKHCKMIVGIEANPSTFKLLEKNILLNKVINSQIFNFAASDSDKNIEFLLNTVNSGGSKRKPLVKSKLYDYDDPEVIWVSAKSLDSVLVGNHFEIIIMDIEGSEYFALKGMPELLTHCNTLIMEFTPHHLKNVSGCSVDDLLKLLVDFQYLYVPSKSLKIQKSDFSYALNLMYDNEREEKGLIFTKHILL